MKYTKTFELMIYSFKTALQVSQHSVLSIKFQMNSKISSSMSRTNRKVRVLKSLEVDYRQSLAVDQKRIQVRRTSKLRRDQNFQKNSIKN